MKDYNHDKPEMYSACGFEPMDLFSLKGLRHTLIDILQGEKFVSKRTQKVEEMITGISPRHVAFVMVTLMNDLMDKRKCAKCPTGVTEDLKMACLKVVFDITVLKDVTSLGFLAKLYAMDWRDIKG